MKNLLFLLLITAFSAAPSGARAGLNAEQEKRYDRAPFWISPYDEFNDFQDPEKEIYLGRLKKAVAKFEVLKNLDADKLKDASEWYQAWDGIRYKIYAICDKSPRLAECLEVENARLETLDMFSSRHEASADIENEDELSTEP